MKKLVIIPIDGEKSDKFFQTKVDHEEKHIIKLNEYIKKNNIDLDEEKSFYYQALMMAMQGYCVVKIDDVKFDAYIPLKVTKEQYKWFEDMLAEIKRFKVTGLFINKVREEYEIKEVARSRYLINPTIIFYQTLAKKVVSKEDLLNDTERSNRIRR